MSIVEPLPSATEARCPACKAVVLVEYFDRERSPYPDTPQIFPCPLCHAEPAWLDFLHRDIQEIRGPLQDDQGE